MRVKRVLTGTSVLPMPDTINLSLNLVILWHQLGKRCDLKDGHQTYMTLAYLKSIKLFCNSLFLSFFFFRYTLPLTEGKSNVTILDSQIQKLRSRSLSQIHEAAVKMRSEATEVKSTLAEIEDWLDKLMQLTDEVGLLNYTNVTWYERGILWNGTKDRIGW